jgi:hypothetical protein
MVIQACTKHGMDPLKSGWIGPKPNAVVSKFKPTSELVHGIAVGSSVLADILRKAGVFSGKEIKAHVDRDTVDDVRTRHHDKVMKERKKEKKNLTIGE